MKAQPCRVRMHCPKLDLEEKVRINWGRRRHCPWHLDLGFSLQRQCLQDQVKWIKLKDNLDSTPTKIQWFSTKPMLWVEWQGTQYLLTQLLSRIKEWTLIWLSIRMQLSPLGTIFLTATTKVGLEMLSWGKPWIWPANNREEVQSKEWLLKIGLPRI